MESKGQVGGGIMTYTWKDVGDRPDKKLLNLKPPRKRLQNFLNGINMKKKKKPVRLVT